MKILKINRKNFRETLREIVNSIEQGKVVICPSDTVYGLICDAQNEKAVKQIFKIKKRIPQKAIALFVGDIKMAKELAVIDAREEQFLKKFWPGKVTVVLKSKKEIQGVKFARQLFNPLKGITRQGTIGLRMPKHKLLLELLQELKRPLAQTSANISGQPALTKIHDVLEEFEKKKDQPDLVLDAGNLKPSLPSTVIDLSTRKIKILRKGAVDKLG